MTPSTNTEERFIVGLEIGSSRAKIGVAGFDPSDTNGELTVYTATTLSTVDSVRYGRITNIRDVQEIISRLVKSVESTPPVKGRRILGVYVNIGGRTLKSKKVSARTVFPDRREITAEMLSDLKDDALATLPTDVELVCTEPLRFKVDNIVTPRPVGTLGSHLAGEFTAVICSPSNKADLRDVVVERAGLSICGLAVRPVAVANLVLSPAETNAGCMLVDIGAETITVAIYRHYALHYLATIPIGSRLITRDLASSLARTEEDAENIKINLGDATPETTDDRQRKNINMIITARLADLMANIAKQPDYADLRPEQLSGGIILTGGGAKMPNICRLLESYTHLKVRIATPPTNIAIADTSLSGPDNIDLIALLNDAANDARRNPEYECLSPLRNTVKEEEEKQGNVVLDFTRTDEPDTDEPGTDEPEEPQPLYGYGRDEVAVTTVAEENDYVDDIVDDDDDNDDIILTDDPDADKPQGSIRSGKNKPTERRKKPDGGKKKPKNDDDEDSEDKQHKPGLLDNIISRLTGLLNSGTEDNSADLDQ